MDENLSEFTQNLLKGLNIPFGLQPNKLTEDDVDVDPTLGLINHIWDCVAALNDVNKVYRKKDSKATVLGSMTLFGFNMEIARILNNIVTMDAFINDETSNDVLLSSAINIFKKFPEITTNRHKKSGKAFIHHAAQNISPYLAPDIMSIHVKLFPEMSKFKDQSGAVPLHWATVNKRAEPAAVNILINSYPAGCLSKDKFGFIPLHWALLRDDPDLGIIKVLIKANPASINMAANDGSLPIHTFLKKKNPSLDIISTLVSASTASLQQKDNDGMIPIHHYCNRENHNMEILRYLLDNYTKCTMRVDNRKRTALHIAVDQANPSEESVKAILMQYSKACELPDIDGYLPIHYCLDGDESSVAIAKLLIEVYPIGVSKATNDGYLPIHCLLFNRSPDISLIKKLIELYPQGAQQVAVDLVPVDDTADPRYWSGPLKEKRWTPLSKAIELAHKDVITLLQSALPKTTVDGGSGNESHDIRMRTPLSGLKPVRPLPPGFLPSTLRQAAYLAKNNSQFVKPMTPLDNDLQSDIEANEDILKSVKKLEASIGNLSDRTAMSEDEYDN